jgi:hypothetical protein
MRSERSRRRLIPVICSAAALIAVGLAGIARAEPHTFQLSAPDAHDVYLLKAGVCIYYGYTCCRDTYGTSDSEMG